MAALCAGASAWADAPEPPRGQPIVEIRYETRNVFEGKAADSNKLFAAADAVHRTTRRRVIERELLFGVGDPYDPDLVRETERNLRALPFLSKVEVVGVETSSGAVVIVRTWDAWTLSVTGSFKRAGGVSNTSAGLSDGNVMGSGKTASAVYSKSGASIMRTASYSDPQAFGQRHLRADVRADESTNDRDYSLTFGRPFFASIARHSLTAGGRYTESRTGIYQGFDPAGVVGSRHYDMFGEYGYALEASPRRTQRLRLRLQQRHDDFAGVPDEAALFVPNVEEHTGLVAAYDYGEVRYIKQKRIQKLSREEDFNMGLIFQPSIEYDPHWRALGATGERLAPQVDLRKGFVSELGHFLFLRADYVSAYTNGRAGDTVAFFNADYFCRYFPRHTVAVHAQFDRGWRLDAPTLLRLGEDNGLRGYRSQQFQGDRRLLFNVEERMFWAEDVLHLFDAGGAVFFDSGNAWMPDQSASIADMKSSYGFGLRFAASRSASNVPIRIDVAHALNDNNFPTRWTVSFQAGTAFGPN